MQNILADFEQQRKACLKNFKDIFDAVDITRYANVAEFVRKVNCDYLTNFDEVTFSIVHEFLKQNVKNYGMPSMELGTENEFDELMRKYE